MPAYVNIFVRFVYFFNFLFQVFLLSSIYLSWNMIGGKEARSNINIFIYFIFTTCLWVGFRGRLMGNTARMGEMRNSRKLHSATVPLRILKCWCGWEENWFSTMCDVTYSKYVTTTMNSMQYSDVVKCNCHTITRQKNSWMSLKIHSFQSFSFWKKTPVFNE